MSALILHFWFSMLFCHTPFNGANLWVSRECYCIYSIQFNKGQQVAEKLAKSVHLRLLSAYSATMLRKRIRTLNENNQAKCITWVVHSSIHTFIHPYIHTFLHSFIHSSIQIPKAVIINNSTKKKFKLPKTKFCVMKKVKTLPSIISAKL